MTTEGASRRRFLAGTAATLLASRSASARAIPDGLAMKVLSFDDDYPFVRRASVISPAKVAEGEKLPVLVLLHGLGEAKQGADVGTFAWVDRYGVASSYTRLRSPPLQSVEKRHDLTKERAKELDAELGRRAFGGFVLVCPFTPNVWSYKSTPFALDSFSDFVAGPLLDRVGSELPFADTTAVGLDGCSLGGYIALEMFLRKSQRFRSLGVLQPAIANGQITRYVDGVVLARGKNEKLRTHVETSTHDPYLPVSKRLASELTSRDVPCDLTVPPGPHDQIFLRDVGTLEMLLWHDRALRT